MVSLYKGSVNFLIMIFIEHMETIERTMEEQNRAYNHLVKSLLRDFGPR